MAIPKTLANQNSGDTLEARGLCVDFAQKNGGIRAVDHVSLTLSPGRTVGMVGESGSGKSMTALALMGLLPAGGKLTAGEIRLGDTPLPAPGDPALDRIRGRHMAMIFQEPMTALNPTLTIGDILSEPLRRHLELSEEQARERAAELLARVGIPRARERLNVFPHQLSGGMRQRAMIALAISCGPSFLIADEPTTALDVTIQAQVLDLLAELSDTAGLGILLITHDLAVVSEVADDVIVMYAGRIVENGPADAVVHRPKHPYTQGLLRTLPAAHLNAPAGKRLPAIPGNVPALDQLPRGCRFSDRCERADDACRRTDPELTAVGPDHHAACIKIDGGDA